MINYRNKIYNKISNERVNSSYPASSKAKKTEFIPSRIYQHPISMRSHGSEYKKFHKKTLTVAFWDVSGFSKLCNTLKDKYQEHMVIDFLHEYYNEANRIIYEHNGTVDKFIGDGVMAYFGYRSSDDGGRNSAIDAVNAAFTLQQSFKEIESKWVKIWKNQLNNDLKLGIKCGINTDTTLIGKIKTEARDEVSVFGPTVNFASRLEQKAERDQIIVSETTKNKIDKTFNLRSVYIDNNDSIKAFENVNECYEVINKLRFK